METNKILSSLCYFSLFFAAFIFPIAVYFIVDNPEVKAHAKSSLISHIVPFLSFVLLVFPILFSGGEPTLAAIGGVFVLLLLGLINFAVVVWNIVKGVKVLIN